MKPVNSITIFDDDNITLLYHPISKIVHMQFHRFLFGKPFRNALDRVAETFLKYSACKWLSDDRENTAISNADLEWCERDWFPRVAKAGWKYWAIVKPEKIIGQMTMRKLADSYRGRGIVAQMFTDVEEAMQWLAKC